MKRTTSTKAHLLRALDEHLKTIQETFQMLEQPASASLNKVDWAEVTKLGDEISKQATIAGMLSTAEAPNAKELQENMDAYCNVLQGFLLLCHGSTVGAGQTLCSNIHSSAKEVTDRSSTLLREGASSYGTHVSSRKSLIPQLTGSVWEACTALKKTPTANCTAIGRAITQVAVSVKDVLREMKELKPAEAGPPDETSNATTNVSNGSHNDDNLGDIGNDLSPEEMKLAQLSTNAISDTLTFIKEVIRFVASLLKQSKYADKSNDTVGYLERILKLCQEIGAQVDELGACIYPPQEVSLMRVTMGKILEGADGVRGVVQNMEGESESLSRAFEGLEASMKQLELGLNCLDDELVPEIQGLSMTM
ncbi:hypothetical protein QJS10_CPB12g00303 [Acorus calamus]|uniref:Uncharacterized protein n=1 Tax=Acorus calamus TaxID=4465 RepID=A0AAV9DJM2_ACOCL|nr:hypothetical protein QJS10_CPB12g00303 [Acorus calamus]